VLNGFKRIQSVEDIKRARLQRKERKIAYKKSKEGAKSLRKSIHTSKLLSKYNKAERILHFSNIKNKQAEVRSSIYSAKSYCEGSYLLCEWKKIDNKLFTECFTSKCFSLLSKKYSQSFCITDCNCVDFFHYDRILSNTFSKKKPHIIIGKNDVKIDIKLSPFYKKQVEVQEPYYDPLSPQFIGHKSHSSVVIKPLPVFIPLGNKSPKTISDLLAPLASSTQVDDLNTSISSLDLNNDITITKSPETPLKRKRDVSDDDDDFINKYRIDIRLNTYDDAEEEEEKEKEKEIESEKEIEKEIESEKEEDEVVFIKEERSWGFTKVNPVSPPPKIRNYCHRANSPLKPKSWLLRQRFTTPATPSSTLISTDDVFTTD
jgi:hypothetical protein